MGKWTESVCVVQDRPSPNSSPTLWLFQCVASQAQLEQNLSYVEIGKAKGATLLTGGERLSRGTDGFYMAPALLVDSTAAMRINRE